MSEADHADAPEEESGRHLVQSLSRGLAVIRAFDRNAASMTLSDVAHRTGLSRAVARRFLLTLVRDGYATTDGKYFRLAPKVLDLGYAFLTSLDVWAVAQPVMAEVVAQTGEACSAAVLDGAEIVYVARVAAGRIIQVGLNVGSRLPAFCTAMGRVLLAGLPPAQMDAVLAEAPRPAFTDRTLIDETALRAAITRAGTAGYAVVDEELEIGLRSLAVPIHSRAGEVRAAMSISLQTSRGPLAQVAETCLPALRRATSRITELMR